MMWLTSVAHCGINPLNEARAGLMRMPLSPEEEILCERLEKGEPTPGAERRSDARALASAKRAPARKPGGAGRAPQSIVLGRPVTPLFAELRQMLLVDEIDPGLHVGMPALDQDREFTHQPARAKPLEHDFLRRALGQGIRQCRQCFFEWAGHAAA
jgi:hypothetical protein